MEISMGSRLIDWLNSSVLTATGAVIAWYTVETYRLRREAQRQTELQNRPFLLVECPSGGLNGEVVLRNVGSGVALNVSIRPIEINEDAIVEHLGLAHLAPAE